MRQQTLASQASFEKFGRMGKRELYLDYATVGQGRVRREY
jgi:hypothetical protein